MIIAMIISGSLALIGILLNVYYFVFDSDDIIFKIGTSLFFVGASLAIIFVLIASYQQSETTKEYPASKYTLSYKVTEFEGQRDTTYVIIPKEGKK